MGELLLELLSEEIPARMQRRAIADLTGLLRDRLATAEIPATRLQGFVTPRRLTVIADGIPARQPHREEERRGPRLGAPPQAIGGFLRAVGLGSIDQCEIRATDRGEFYFAVLQTAGRPTSEVLPELIHAAMTALPWPKSMRFPASSLRWVRPLNAVICLFDGEVVPLPLDQVAVGRVTRGHRFLSPGEIEVADGADYVAKLEATHVVLDPDRRRQIIARGLAERAAAEGLTVKPDLGLLDEVTGLVEYPVVLMGNIDADFVQPLPDGLPPEVLATAMRAHQKYFSCLNPDGTPAPRFLFVANNLTPDGGKTIAAGNERVLRARLSDARFFWDRDCKVRLESRVEALKGRVYHEKLGSVFDKVERMEKLAAFLAPYANASPSLASRGARLAKADLSTGMVGEFPELQGVMGRYYALHDGENSRVADAIAEHYKPLGPGDTCPTTAESITVSLADKMDTLAGFFAKDERPTGSGDPFALRRAAQGIIRDILENNLRLSLTQCFARALELVPPEPSFDSFGPRLTRSTTDIAGLSSELVEFIADRLKVHLREEGIRHDLIAAVFSYGKHKVEKTYLGIGEREDDLVRLLARVAALQSLLDTDDGADLLTAYRRASNIVAIEERRDDRHYDRDVDQTMLQQPEEHALAADLDLVSIGVRHSLDHEEFTAAMGHLASMRRHIDEFFDKVTVNTEDKKLRENRLRLLSRIRAVMNQVADFSKIEG